MKMKHIITILFTLSLLQINAQCVDNNAFDIGEKLEFTGYYNWGFLWVNAGKVKITVKETEYHEKPAYKIKGSARNAKAFEMFFKLRDTLTTIVDKKTLAPYSLDRITNEADYHTRHVYAYQYPQKKIQTYIKKNSNKVKSFDIPLEGCVNNIMSILYYARNIDYDNLEEGTKIPLKMLVDGKISNVEIRYKGVGRVETRHGNKFECYKITPVLPDGTMFEGGDGMVVWLSKDKNRVPVMVEAKIPVGSVKGILENYSGLRHADNIFGKTKGTFEKGK